MENFPSTSDFPDANMANLEIALGIVVDVEHVFLIRTGWKLGVAICPPSSSYARQDSSDQVSRSHLAIKSASPKRLDSNLRESKIKRPVGASE